MNPAGYVCLNPNQAIVPLELEEGAAQQPPAQQPLVHVNNQALGRRNVYWVKVVTSVVVLATMAIALMYLINPLLDCSPGETWAGDPCHCVPLNISASLGDCVRHPPFIPR